MNFRLKSIDSNWTRLRLTRLSIMSSAPARDSTLNGGVAWATSGRWALATIARGTTVFLKSPPSSCSKASHDEPQYSVASCPVSRFVPPGQSAAGPPRGLSPPTGS